MDHTSGNKLQWLPDFRSARKLVLIELSLSNPKMDKISGKTEFDVFKNYYTAEKRESCRLTVNASALQSKDNVISERLRLLAKTDFLAKKFYECLEKYTDCLRYATFNGRDYALALANRSGTYFAMGNYKNCLIDISLSLQADYPMDLKPKLLIRKAKCFIKMGNFKEMVETIEDCCNQMQANSELSKINKDHYMKEMKSLMGIKELDVYMLPVEETAFAPEVILEKNQDNPNVSASIKLIYNKNTGFDYVAARDIPRGEVLFVEAAYSIGFSRNIEGDPIGTFLCNNCWKEAKNCIPCKTCVNYVFCSEDCLDSAWTEYHQWECDMFRSKLFEGELCLAVRTLIKGAFSGPIFKISENTESCKFSKDINPYLQMYSLHLDLASFRSKCTATFFQKCEKASMMVEFLKKTNFFTRLMSVSSCQKDFDALVNFVGGLLIRHIIQVYQRSLIMHCSSTIISINEHQRKLDYLLASKNLKYNAFCPTVSGVKYSCESNTSMYFDRSTCIVKACQDIKAGSHISRSALNLTTKVSTFARRSILQIMDINCDCTACNNINNNIDILNTYLCNQCGRFALVEAIHSPVMVCNDCKFTTSAQAIHSRIGSEISATILRENSPVGQNLEKMIIISTNVLKKLVNPNHELLYNNYKELLLIYSVRDNFQEFKKALLDFKTCAKNRNGRFEAFQYVMDLTFITKSYFNHLDLNISILPKQEIKDLLSYISDVINEAKEIAEFTFPPLLRLYAILEFHIFQFRVTHVSLED